MNPGRPKVNLRRFGILAFAGLLHLASVAAQPRLLRADQAGQATPAPGTPGHSFHGESFNEGPRQRAALLGNTGRVRFAVTTAAPQAQAFIEQGVGQLHGFWYWEAERSFRQAALLDPNCAMAYWGMAMANINNEKRAKGFVAEAVKRKGQASLRENLYIDALDAFFKADPKKDKERHAAYAKALEKLIYKFPDDIEAKAFLGLQLWLNRSHGTEISSHLAVDALLKEVLAVEPLHPCHHYRIHLWDYELAERALDSSALCGQGAPGVAHMWHMPGHIYSRLARYEDAVWQMEASARVDHAYMIRERIFPDQIHNYAHNNEWLIRNLASIGRVASAIELAKNLCELPRHPRLNTLSGGKSAQFGRQRLFEELTRYELWEQLVALCHSPYLEPTEDRAEQVKRLRHLGAAYIRMGNLEAGRAQLAELERRAAFERAQIEQLGLPTPGQPAPVQASPAGSPTAAEPRPEPVPLPEFTADEQKRLEEEKRRIDGRLRPVELAVEELLGHLAAAQGDYRAALPRLRKAGGVEAIYLARVQLLAGEREAALKEARSHADSHKNEVAPLAGLVALLWEANEKQEAQERFAALRGVAGQADLELPVINRVAPVAAALGLPADWRLPRAEPPDTGARPALESLGPFRWHPAPAVPWMARDVHGRLVSSSQYHGRAHVLIFYLGAECLHCAQQLQAFAPLTSEFEQMGVSLVGISTDDRGGLQKSLSAYAPGPFPFALFSDHEQAAFRAFRAFDEFEEKPLHGTFLIDAAGLVRWHDVGHEPFQDGRFLLNEARRLMSLQVQPQR
jgi:peroxiredoxin